MSHLWIGFDLMRVIGAQAETGFLNLITGVSIDTRTLTVGDVFLAIRGERMDGHAFVQEALAKGAAAAVVDEQGAASLAGVGVGPLFIVPDTLQAMIEMGRVARARTEAPIVAVTGSVGKTSVKEGLRHVLEAQGKTHASVASYNNHWGVPLTLARMPPTSRFGIFELGMNASGEIAALTHQVRPDVAIITAVGPVHLAFFPSVAAIADAKAEIFCGLEPGGVAVLNRDEESFSRLAAHAGASRAGQIVSFGKHSDADVRAERLTSDENGMCVNAQVFGRSLTYRLAAHGQHHAMNSLGILAVVHALGADVDAAAHALESFTPVAGRGTREMIDLPSKGPFLLIDESYNANPASMRAAIDVLGAAPGKRRIAVLGDMLELGESSSVLHAGLAETVRDAKIDLVFTVGPLMRFLWDALPNHAQGKSVQTVSEIETDLIATLQAGDVVMLKGSNGIRLERLATRLREMGNLGLGPINR